MEAFDPDTMLACVNLFQDLGGAKGLGLKRKKEYKSACKLIVHYLKPMKMFVNIQIRTIKLCLHPILYNFDYLAHYYLNLKKAT